MRWTLHPAAQPPRSHRPAAAAVAARAARVAELTGITESKVDASSHSHSCTRGTMERTAEACRTGNLEYVSTMDPEELQVDTP